MFAGDRVAGSLETVSFHTIVYDWGAEYCEGTPLADLARTRQ